MAGASLLTLIDDIATLLDDISVMTKVAARKTAGVLGDDLALNAQQVTGVRAEREIPVVWAVAKGSLKNKLILVPAALAISAVAPWAITPLLMLGGAFLCFEGFEKIAHHWLGHAEEDATHHQQQLQALADPTIDMVQMERDKIRGAVRTDFILSAEIIVIALGTVREAAFTQQVLVVSLIAAVMTVGVYGIVAGIVKLDDAGLYLMESSRPGPRGRFRRAFGQAILSFCPYLMKTLSVVGTAAMFLVGGSILLHGIPGTHDLMHHIVEAAHALPLGEVAAVLTPTLINGLAGVLAGAIVAALVSVLQRLLPKSAGKPERH